MERWRPHDTYRGLYDDDSEFRSALSRLQSKGLGLACAILDGVLTSEQIADLSPEYVQALVRATHEAGGLWIADEVQARCGAVHECAIMRSCFLIRIPALPAGGCFLSSVWPPSFWNLSGGVGGIDESHADS